MAGLWEKLQMKRKLRETEEYIIQQETCVQCGTCAKNCHHHAIRKNADGKYEINERRCHRCGDCMAVCPKQSIIRVIHTQK